MEIRILDQRNVDIRETGIACEASVGLAVTVSLVDVERRLQNEISVLAL